MDKKKIFVLGDSISIHYGPFLEKYLKGFADYSRKEGVDEALLNLDNPLGANGGDSSMVLDFIKSKGNFDADIMLLNCGLHDIKTNTESKNKQISIDEYKSNLLEIIQLVNEMSIKLVWIQTTPVVEEIHNKPDASFHRYNDDCIAYNKVANEIMEEKNIPSIDLYNFTMNLGKDLYCDHVHFNEDIREKQASCILGWLMQYLKD